MQVDPPRLQIESTLEFQRKLGALAKKYRQIYNDIHPIITRLESGEQIGNQIPKLEGYVVFKVRVKNSDIQKGKSSGYRLIYWVEAPTSIVLLDIYTKSEQADVSAREIQRIIAEFEQHREEEGIEEF
ncbi:MAG: type II toxin-antitoxin system RelE/ParE family toxin [Stigonema ocellatum SAG 48.90 = DSM 106950]|nr:type II toxin-antitoxin system RelE/ParE family toxin [Stigonema ocellatum SAG 48.90 = DSM 106950]